MVILLIITLAAIAAPWVAPHDPYQGSLNVSRRARPSPPARTWAARSRGHGHPGHDWNTCSAPTPNGRDILSRIIYAARISLIVGLTAVAIGGTVGVVAGLLSGYYGGASDALIMRIADVQLAFPFILLAIVIIAVLGGGMFNVIIVLGIGSWVPYARVVRGQVLSARGIRSTSWPPARSAPEDTVVLFRHILPNVHHARHHHRDVRGGGGDHRRGHALVPGRGHPGADAHLGQHAGRRPRLRGVGLVAGDVPGLAIMLTVLSINVIGDWLRDFLDPRLRHTA